MTEYEQWLSEQPKEFQEEILGNNAIPEKHRDYNFKSITLQQLRELDNKYN